MGKFNFEPEYLYDIEQGSDRWYKTRMAQITASPIKKLFVAPKDNCDWGAGAMTYMEELANEYITRNRKSVQVKSMAWGHKYEPEARRKYEQIVGAKVTQVGFIQVDDMIGSSPDGLVGDNGIVEIKCPIKKEIFYKYAAAIKKHQIPKEHIPQCLFNTLGGKREWCDFIAYHPLISGYNGIKIVRASVEEMESFATPSYFWETILRFRDDLRNLIKEKEAVKALAEKELSKFDGCDF